MPTANVYALIVGIDNYPIPAHRLEGCVNDATAMKQFMENRVDRTKYNWNPLVLFNEQAKRSAIISGFEAHLAKAQAGDVVFVYFSGHGSQEPAHEVFWHLEPDKKNETLVCWDSRIQDGMDLADKEMATLIDMVAKKNPHVVVVMDCCHSGSGTRDLGTKSDFKTRQANGDRLVNGQVVSTRTSGAGKVRDLSTYYIPQVIRNRDIKLSNPQDLLIPSARHVSLAAAQSFQLAKETHLGGAKRGVFTYSLLETLQNSAGPVSYQDVMRRVSTLVTQRTFDQNPQLDAIQIDDLQQPFLGGTAQKSIDYYSLAPNADKRWEIDGGSVHGMMAGAVMNVYPVGSTADDMRQTAKSLGKVNVTTVNIATSLVTPAGAALDPGKAYKVRVDSLPVGPLMVHFVGNTPADAAGVTLLQNTLKGSPSASSYVKSVATVQACDLQVIARDVTNTTTKAKSGAFLVARKTDTQPLIKQVIGYTQDSANKTIANLVHISKWMQLLKLANSASQIPGNAVQIELFKPTTPEPYKIANGVVPFRYEQGVGAPDKFRVRIKNTHSTRLYCSLVYMSSNFEANPGLYPAAGVWLEPGAEAWALNGAAIAMQVEDPVKSFLGKKNPQSGMIETSTTEIFKLIMSTVEFNPMLLRQVALGQPDPQTRSVGGDGTNTRSLLIPTMEEPGKADDWNTNMLTLTVTRTDKA